MLSRGPPGLPLGGSSGPHAQSSSVKVRHGWRPWWRGSLSQGAGTEPGAQSDCTSCSLPEELVLTLTPSSWCAPRAATRHWLLVSAARPWAVLAPGCGAVQPRSGDCGNSTSMRVGEDGERGESTQLARSDCLWLGDPSGVQWSAKWRQQRWRMDSLQTCCADKMVHVTQTQEDRSWSGTRLQSPFSDSTLPCQLQLDRDRDRD